MIDVGIVGLDTSHPEAFANILAQKETVNVSAVWDDGDVRTKKYAENFCAQFDARRFDRPAEMIHAVDAAMILTVNWDTHADLAVPFLDSDVPTFVDKPIAGRATDLDRIEDAIGGTSLFGGSAVPFHPSFDDFPVDEPDRTLYCAGYNDSFYYGAHLIHVARQLAGADWTKVKPVSDPGIVVDVTFDNGALATLRFDGPKNDTAFGILDIGTKTRTRRIDGNEQAHQKMYDQFLNAFIDAVQGNRDDTDRLINGSRLLLAAHAALDSGTTISPGSDPLRAFRADGEAFLAEYAPYY